jgi:hypothetical protein
MDENLAPRVDGVIRNMALILTVLALFNNFNSHAAPFNALGLP